MSTALLEAAKTLVEAEKESRRASLAVREAHRSCSTHSYGYCADSVCIDAENALESAVRAELEAQTAALAELRKLAAEATAREGGWEEPPVIRVDVVATWDGTLGAWAQR